jgi:hypothetical protein
MIDRRVGGAQNTMTVSVRIRSIHRATSVIFVLTVAANFATMAQGEPPAWVTFAPLAPLLVLLITGTYLFVLPYRSRSSGVPPKQ